jgi:hypothetical protein
MTAPFSPPMRRPRIPVSRQRLAEIRLDPGPVVGRPGPPRYFLLRLKRDGPLVPGRLRWLDHAPEDPPDNKLDRGNHSIVACADIAGAEVPPEELIERTWWASTHWKYTQPISEAEYGYQMQRLLWAERHRPDDPVLRPRRALDPAQIPLPNFDRENAL